MLGAMPWPASAQLLAATLTLLGASALAGAGEKDLRFLRNGEALGSLAIEELRSNCAERSVEVEDPYHLRRKRYRVCPLLEVMRAGFGAGWAEDPERNFFLRARDGYTRPAAAARLAEAGAWLAFADLSNPGSEGWEPIDRRRVDPAPFYLVWSGPGQNDPHRYPWPYQLVEIEAAPFEREYAHTLPRGVSAGDPAWRGFAIFRGECVACHAVNGEGGRVGPELNVPRSIVEYRPAEQIKAYVRDPGSFRHTSMPPHPHLSDNDLDSLLAYFRAMSQRKHDPEKPGGD
ncbi:MAG: cytochrome c [Myxococcota bacterium]